MACDLCGSPNQTHLEYSEANAPALRTSSALQLPAPTYLGNEENSMTALFHVSAWICVQLWSLSNLSWQVDWIDQSRPFSAWLCKNIRWALISCIYLLNTFVCLCVVQWELSWYVPHPTIQHTHHLPLLLEDGLQCGQQCKWARSVVICLCVCGGREVVGFRKIFFGTSSTDWWRLLGGPGLTERRSVWVTSALNCLPPDRSLLSGGQRSPTTDKTSSHMKIHPQIKFPPGVSVRKHVKISIFTGQGLSVCVSLYAGVCQNAEASLLSLQGGALCLFCVSVSEWLYHSDLARFFLSSVPQCFSLTLLFHTMEVIFGKPKTNVTFNSFLLDFFLCTVTHIVFSTVLEPTLPMDADILTDKVIKYSISVHSLYLATTVYPFISLSIRLSISGSREML